MNTFEKELSTANLFTLLSSKEGVYSIDLGVEDKMDIKYGNDGASTHVDGPARVLIVID